jgi:hypothetical protein
MGGVGQYEEVEVTDGRGVACGYRWVTDLPLNQSHPQIRVNLPLVLGGRGRAGATVDLDHGPAAVER